MSDGNSGNGGNNVSGEKNGFEFDEKDMFEGITKNIKPTTRRGLEEAGEVLRKAVQDNLPYSKKKNSSGRPHMRDDVKLEIKAFEKAGGYVKVKGGPKTKGLWGIINDGHIAPNGKMVKGEAFHFLDRALEQSESSIESIIDSTLAEIMNGEDN